MRVITENFEKFSSWSLVLLIAGFGLGFEFSSDSVDGDNHEQILRDPAAVKWVFDYSNLSGSELQKAIRKRVLSQIKYEKSEDGVGFALGHFLLLNPKGEKTYACTEYEKITLGFEAEGEVRHATGKDEEPPKMEVHGPCRYSEDLTSIRALLIPTKKISVDQAGDYEYIFEDKLNSSNNLYVKFRAINNKWPKRWLLKSIQLSKSKNLGPMVFDSQEIVKIHGDYPVLVW